MNKSAETTNKCKRMSNLRDKERMFNKMKR